MPTPAFDPTRKFVRVTELRKDGFVEFDFALGEPELFVEMILPVGVFDDFCAINHVSFVGDPGGASPRRPTGDDWDWSMRDATHQRFKSKPESV